MGLEAASETTTMNPTADASSSGGEGECAAAAVAAAGTLPSSLAAAGLPSAAAAAAATVSTGGSPQPLAVPSLRPQPLSDRTRTQPLFSSNNAEAADSADEEDDDDDDDEDDDIHNDDDHRVASAASPSPPQNNNNNNNNNITASDEVPRSAAAAAAAVSASASPVVSANTAAAAAAAAPHTPTRGRAPVRETTSNCTTAAAASNANAACAAAVVDMLPPARCINPASDVNSRLDTQVEVRVYPCNNSQSNNSSGGKKKFTTFTIKPEGVIIQGNNRNRASGGTSGIDLGAEYAMNIGRKLQRYELSDTRACQLLVTTHAKSFWVVPAPEAFSRHSGTCRLIGDRKHPPAAHTLQVGDFLRVGSVGVVVIETHDGVENRALSEEKIQKIMKDTTNNNGGFLDLAETDGGTWLTFFACCVSVG
jgi:hypothetical protein